MSERESDDSFVDQDEAIDEVSEEDETSQERDGDGVLSSNICRCGLYIVITIVFYIVLGFVIVTATKISSNVGTETSSKFKTEVLCHNER